VESDGGRDGEGREGWRVMEGRGSDGGGGNDGAGPSLSTVGTHRPGAGGRRWPYALAIRRWGCSELSFVGGGARSGCRVWFVGTGFPFVGGGTRSRVVHVRGRGAVVRGCWVVVCGRGGAVSCVVVTISEIGWDGVGTHHY
jgi:hypothetical protein